MVCKILYNYSGCWFYSIKSRLLTFYMYKRQVDDILITGNDPIAISSLKQFIRNHFGINDLGDLKFFLGIKVSRSNKGIFISQRKYTLESIKDGRYLGVKPVDFPMEQNTKLSDEGELLKDPICV